MLYYSSKLCQNYENLRNLLENIAQKEIPNFIVGEMDLDKNEVR